MKRQSPTNRTLATLAWLTVACALGALSSAAASAADATKLQAIDVQTLPGQQLQLTMRLSGPAPQPLSFTIDNPARISFDLPNVALAHLSAQRPDAWAGTWVLNLAKSTYELGPAPKSAVSMLEPTPSGWKKIMSRTAQVQTRFFETLFRKAQE